MARAMELTDLVAAAARGAAQGGGSRQVVAAAVSATIRTWHSLRPLSREVACSTEAVSDAMQLHSDLDSALGAHHHHLGVGLADARAAGLLSVVWFCGL